MRREHVGINRQGHLRVCSGLLHILTIDPSGILELITKPCSKENPMAQQQYTTLVELLKHVPDPRKRQGRRHRWLTLLCLIVAALASAQRNPRAISRWVLSHRQA